MIALYLSGGVFLVVAVAAFFVRRTEKSTTKETAMGLSKPAERIMKRYLEIAPDKRPEINLRGILLALDSKVGRGNADVHFLDNTYSSMYPSWSWTFHSKKVKVGCGGSGSHWDDYKCDFQDYRRLWHEVDDAAQAYHEQVYAIRASGVDTSEVALITERLRTEAGITRQVTKEIQ